MAEAQRVAIYPGSFDPVTHGHLDLVRRALAIFDRVIVAVAVNVQKSGFFTTEERIELLRESIRTEVREHERIELDDFEGLLVDYARRKSASTIIRGLRAVSDFEFEFQMANMNRKLSPDVETLFMMTGEDNFYVSSRLIREVARFGGSVEGLVPAVVSRRLQEKFGRSSE